MVRNLFRFSKEIDQVLAVVGLVCSLFLITYLTIYNTRIIYILTGVLSFLAFLFWLIIREQASINFKPLLRPNTQKALQILFFLIFTLSILFLYERPFIYERPLIYFVLMSLLVGLVVLQISYISNKTHIFMVLFQIICIGISLSWSQQLIFPSLIGIDPWYHQYITHKIIETSYIPPGSYSKIPLFHLMVALTSLVTGLDYKHATMSSISLFQIISNILFIYLIARVLYSENYFVCCLAALLLTISNHSIFMSSWLIPNGFSGAFILPLFYSLFQIKKYNRLIGSLLSMYFGFTIILTHTITSMFIAIALFVLWFSTYLYIYLQKVSRESPVENKSFSYVSLSYVALFIVGMFTWWSFASRHISTLAKLISWGFSREFLIETPQDMISNTINLIPVSEELLYNLGMFLFFSLSFIGCFYMISNRYSTQLSFTFSLVSITPLVIGYSTLLVGFFSIQHRWWYFAQILLSLPLAISCLIIININTKKIMPLFLSIGLTFMSLLLIMSPSASVDVNTFFPHNTMTFAPTSSELKALETVSSFWNDTIKTDSFFAITQERSYHTQSFDRALFIEKNGTLLQEDFILVRNSIIGRPSMVLESLIIPDFDIIELFYSSRYSAIYTSGSTIGYRFSN